MSTALIKIDQSGKTPGVAGRSRDDLSLYTGSGTEITLSDGGVGAQTWQWTLVDQPLGANATLSAPSSQTTQLIGANIEGSYLVRLVVDGGVSVGQRVESIAAVQIPLPSWITPGVLRFFRIPATGETTEFNSDSSPSSGSNTRGWALELSYILRAIAKYGFGIRGKNNGADIAAEPFYTVDTVPSDNPNMAYFSPTSNAYLQPNSNKTDLVVTAAEHINDGHSSCLLLPENTTNRSALQCGIEPSTNPMTLYFQQLNVSGSTSKVTVNGATFDTSSLPSMLSYALPATTGKALKLIELEAGSPPSITSSDIGHVTTSVLNMVVVNISPNFPDGAVTITNHNGNISANGGPLVESSREDLIRIYLPDGINWIDAYCYDEAVEGSEIWTFSGSKRYTSKRFPIAVLPYWLHGSVSTWGYEINGDQFCLDVRRIGSIGLANIQDQVLDRVDRIAQDMRWKAGVVFSHDEYQYFGGERHLGSFALIPETAGTPLQKAIGMHGGVVWVNGRRVEVPRSVIFSSIGNNTAVCIAVRVSSKLTYAEFVALPVLSGDPVKALRACLAEASAKDDCEVFVPLYFGKLDSTGKLLADGRIDLRRDVAHYGTYTVACRDSSIATENYFRKTYSSRINNTTPTRSVYGIDEKASAEFGSIAAALVWHSAVTGGDNITPTQSYVNNVNTRIEVIGDTLETFPIHLRSNVSIVGKGSPFIFCKPSQWWAAYGISAYNWSYFSVGNSYNSGVVYDVTIRDVSIIATEFNPAIHGAGSVLSIYAGDYVADNLVPSTWTVLGATSNVLIQNVGFDLIDTSLLTSDSSFTAITLNAVNPANGGGNFHGVTIDNCYNHLLAKVAVTDKRAFNYGIQLVVDNTKGAQQIQVTITNCKFSTNSCGLLMGGDIAYLNDLRIADNYFEVTQSGFGANAAYGMQLGCTMIFTGYVCRNILALRYPTTTISVAVQCNASLVNCTISDNVIESSYGTSIDSGGFYFSGGMYATHIDNNTIRTNNNGIKIDSGSSELANVTFSRNIVVNEAVVENSIGLQLANSSNLLRIQITDNVFSQFATGILVVTTSTSMVNLTDNVIDSDRSIIPSYGMQFSIATSSKNLTCSGNSILGQRVGIQLQLPITSSCNTISNNTISGQTSTSTFGPSSRGIHLTWGTSAGTSNVGVSIVGNTIDSVCGISTEDTNPSGGVVIVNTSGYANRDIQVNDNNIVVHEPSASLTNAEDSYTSGIIFIGAYGDVQVNSNKVKNEALKLYTADRHGGIVFLDTSAVAASGSHAFQINDNSILWVDASYSDAVDTSAAGVLFEIPSGMSDVQVNNNNISVQSLANNAGSIGSVHGILVKGTNGLPKGLQIKGNNIDALKVIASSAPGICGTGIWVYGGDMLQASICGNKCFGYFRKTTSAGHSNDFAGIAVNCIPGHGAIIDVNCSENTVTILNGDADGAVGPQNIAYGIKVGSTQASGLCQYARVSSNHIDAYLDGRSSANAAAIAVHALYNGTSMGDSLVAQTNFIRRVVLNKSVVSGLLNYGWANSQFSDNRVLHDAYGTDLLENTYSGATNSNIWSNNYAGSPTAAGSITLAAPPYKAQTSVNNYNGVTFS